MGLGLGLGLVLPISLPGSPGYIRIRKGYTVDTYGVQKRGTISAIVDYLRGGQFPLAETDYVRGDKICSDTGLNDDIVNYLT